MIGIFGGSFSPIHNGHLRLAIEAREQLQLSEVRLLPAAQPPLREVPAIPAARRLRWVHLAVEGEPGLIADARELRRQGPSYTADTLAELRAEHPDTPLCLLLGQDAVRQLPQWQRWQSLIDYAHLVFFDRPGQAPELPAPLARLWQQRQARGVGELRQKAAGLCWRCALPPLDVSSSDIRRRLCRGLSVRGLVPDAVLRDFNPSDLEAFGQDENPAAR